jgi:hypothetical protein
MTLIRTEAYLGGRLIKEIAQLNMGPTAARPYDLWVDGRHRWLLDGAEVTEDEAQALITGPAE